MKRCFSMVVALAFLIVAAPAMAVDSLFIASGAGYKVVVEALARAFTEESGVAVERIHGNMAQIMGQARNSGKVDLLIGEESFLAGSPLPLAASTPLGMGRLVLAWPKAKPEPRGLDVPEVERVAIPDPKKAIYGKAAMEYLERSGQLAALKDKLLVVGTVPQVFAYLSTAEVDAGFLNLTQALAAADHLGGYRVLENELYTPIAIECFQLKTAPNPKAAKDFARFLESGTARSILAAHGL